MHYLTVLMFIGALNYGRREESTCFCWETVESIDCTMAMFHARVLQVETEVWKFQVTLPIKGF
jgi:hypothetical protein